MASELKIKLSSGQEMPALGFGTWQASEEELEQAVEDALSAGYRHIDTATVYENEKSIGKVLRRWLDAGKVRREELFIVTKLPPSGNRPEGVAKFLKISLENLQLDYLDMYLVHTPFAFADGDDFHPMSAEGEIIIDPNTDHLANWKEMEAQVDAGLTKSIGISNFNRKQVERILENCRIPPACLQIEVHAYFQQKDMIAFCKKKGIAVTGYSPLGSRGIGKLFAKIGHNKQVTDILDNEVVKSLAKKYTKSEAQILLRHLIQKGIAAIPKSTNAERIKQNIAIFDFELDAKDVEELDALDMTPDGRVCDFSFFKGLNKHPEFPF